MNAQIRSLFGSGRSDCVRFFVVCRCSTDEAESPKRERAKELINSSTEAKPRESEHQNQTENGRRFHALPIQIARNSERSAAAVCQHLARVNQRRKRAATCQPQPRSPRSSPEVRPEVRQTGRKPERRRSTSPKRETPTTGKTPRNNEARKPQHRYRQNP